MANHQGGKAFGQLRKQAELSLDEIIKTYLDNADYAEFEDLEERLHSYKKQFMEFDLDNSGDIDIMELKMMMEKLGQAKTHLELKKMISEVDRCNRGSIGFNDFLFMMLGKKNSVLKLILKFEEAMKGQEEPSDGSVPKRDMSTLP